MIGDETLINTSYRGALRSMASTGRLDRISESLSGDCEVAGIMKRLDGDRALWFDDVDGSDFPVAANVLASPANCEAAFGLDAAGLRGILAAALGSSLPPEVVEEGPVHENVMVGDDVDLGILPVLKHTPLDGGRFITGGIVIVRDPETGIHNASYHRMQIIDRRTTAIKLDFGRHLRSAHAKAQRLGVPLAVAVCIGTDLGLMYAAAAMGSQMPEEADELAVAGAIGGAPLRVVRCVSQDLIVPAETEIVIEGMISPSDTVEEGPFAEFVGYMAPAGDAPVFTATAITHRDRAVYHAINGFGRETVMLRKYVLEATLLAGLRSAVPAVVDVNMTAGGLHRFHAVLAVRKESPRDDGIQRNAALAAFATLKDLDCVTVVDDDIDIHDPFDVEYAVATRVEASRDLVVVPGARGHEYIRVGDRGIGAKWVIDATVPFADRSAFQRAAFADRDTPVAVDAARDLPW